MWYVVVEMAPNMTKTPMPLRSENESSKFHWLFLGNQHESDQPYDRPIMETKNFVVLPSLGSIVPGWLLVVPKWPVARIADISPDVRDEFEELVFKVRKIAEREFGQTFLFEHGGFAGSSVSCGVDQAHLHIVPLPFDLTTAALESKEERWVECDSSVFPYDICGLEEYWYVSSDRLALTKAVTTPESQWFRKLIASELRCADAWDYKKFSFLENIQGTIKVMGLHG